MEIHNMREPMPYRDAYEQRDAEITEQVASHDQAEAQYSQQFARELEAMRKNDGACCICPEKVERASDCVVTTSGRIRHRRCKMPRVRSTFDAARRVGTVAA